MQEKQKINETEPFDHKATPEQLLWLAVIERALLDYACPTSDSQKCHNIGLDWFFYELKSKPYNLEYICENFLNFPAGAEKVRKRLERLINSEFPEQAINRSRRYKGFY
jgi:hypothetical protein